MKDNFSSQSNQYLKFRPTYPKEMFEYIASLCVSRLQAWDCGTGNGQVAIDLALYFEKVIATDISEKQILNAIPNNKVIYKVEGAEETAFQDHSFDLISVAQAIHWFDFNKFYQEVHRTIKDKGIIAVIGYGLIKVDEVIDPIISKLYTNILGSYWDKERRYIDENYDTIPFPFHELKVPQFKNEFNWTIDQLIGYFSTWSAVQHYITKNGSDPVALVMSDLKEKWETVNIKKINFPILLRIGRISK